MIKREAYTKVVKVFLDAGAGLMAIMGCFWWVIVILLNSFGEGISTIGLAILMIGGVSCQFGMLIVAVFKPGVEVQNVRRPAIRYKKPAIRYKKPAIQCHTTTGPGAFVYLIRGVNSHKIGITGNVARRVKDLQTANEVTLKVIQTMKCGGREACKEAERMLHDKYDSKRSQAGNEWFNLSKEEVVSIRKFMTANTLSNVA